MATIVLGTSDGIRTIGADRPELLLGADVTALAPGTNCVWALVDRELVRVAGDVRHIAAAPAHRALCVHATGDVVWVGTAEAHLLRCDGDALVPVESFDTAPRRTEWHTPWGGPPDTRSMAGTRDELLVNVHVGGILRSNDGGVTWSATLDLRDDVHQVALGADGTVWAATGAAALAESRDGGDTWTHHSDGLHGTYLRAVAPTDDGALVTASSGPHASDGAAYRFDGEHFHPCDSGMPARFAGNLDTYRLAAAGATAALAGLDGRLYLSEDGGRTWIDVAGNLPEVRAVVIA
jgi:hypothetical protein